MIITWRGKGILAPLVFGFGFGVGMFVAPDFSWPLRHMSLEIWKISMGCAAGSYAVWRVGMIWNEDEAAYHRLYFVPVQYWGVIGFVATIGILVSGIASFRQPGGTGARSIPHDAAGGTVIPDVTPRPPKGEIVTSAGVVTPLPQPDGEKKTPAQVYPAPTLPEAKALMKLMGVIKTGADLHSWLFEVDDEDGRQHLVHLGENIGDWQVTSFQDGRLKLSDAKGGVMILRLSQNI